MRQQAGGASLPPAPNLEVVDVIGRNEPRACSVQGCGGTHASRGYCGRHYQEMRRAGALPVISPHRPLEERMKLFSDRSPCHGGCWVWTGTRSRLGYGMVSVSGRMRTTHRVAFELAYGSIPPGNGYHGTCVCHRCDNPACINPAHLFLGTHRENMIDMKRKVRYTKLHGESHGSAKITEAQARDILDSGGTHRAIAERYGVSRSLVTAIKNGRIWSYLSEGTRVAA